MVVKSFDNLRRGSGRIRVIPKRFNGSEARGYSPHPVVIRTASQSFISEDRVRN